MCQHHHFEVMALRTVIHYDRAFLFLVDFCFIQAWSHVNEFVGLDGLKPISTKTSHEILKGEGHC